MCYGFPMLSRKLKIALEFLTIFCVGKPGEEIAKEDIANSVVFFPLVGLLLGGFCASAEIILDDYISSVMARSLFPIIILAIFSRGLHLDGVADTFDALHFADNDKEKAIEVMKGKTIGAFGTSALVLVIVGKLVSISALPEEFRIESLLLIPALSRWTSSIVARQSGPAEPEGLGFIFTAYTTRKACFISGLIALAISVLILGKAGLMIFALVSVLGFFLSSYFNRAFGGVTGDVFGAVIELSEVFGFFVVGIVVR